LAVAIYAGTTSESKCGVGNWIAGSKLEPNHIIEMRTSTTVYVISAPKMTTVNPLLAAYLARLIQKPLQTKMITAGRPLCEINPLLKLIKVIIVGFLSFLQEILANHIAGVPVPATEDAPVYEKALAAVKINSRAAKMAAYGAFISAPMNHVLVGALQRTFAGQTSLRAKLLQLIVSNIFIAPIQAGGMEESLLSRAP
jgi:peroxisomal membrane protein 2